MHYILKALTVLVAIGAGALLQAAPAFAHASLMASDPPADAVLAETPGSVVLTFSEPVSLISASLVRSDGSSTPLTEATASGATLSIGLPGDQTAGTRVVSWRAVSADGHPISGALVFSVGEATGAPDLPDTAPDALAAGSLWLFRAVTFIALFFGVGSAGFRIIAPLAPPARRLALGLIACGLVTATVGIGLQGLDALAAGLPVLIDVNTWSLGLSTAYGATAIVEIVALLCGGAALVVPNAMTGRILGGAGILTIAFAVSLSGHASTAEPGVLARSALFVHIACIAWWTGGLYPLALELKKPLRLSAPALIAFSRLIPFAIVPLLASGIILAVIQLGWPGASWQSPYGAILAAKLALLAVLFAIASWNRWVLTAPAARGSDSARIHMRRTIVVEMALIVVVLGLVSGWRFTPPPRVLAAAAAADHASVVLRLEQEDVTAEVAVSPAHAGVVNVRIHIRNDAGPLAVKGVAISVSQPALGIAPIKSTAEMDEDGAWVSELTIPVPGSWSVDVQVRVSDFQLVRLRGEMTIAS